MYTLILSFLLNATGDPQVVRYGSAQEVTGADLTCFSSFVTDVWPSATVANTIRLNCWRRNATVFCVYQELKTGATASDFTTAVVNKEVVNNYSLDDIASDGSTINYTHKYPKVSISNAQKTALAACINGKFSIPNITDVRALIINKTGSSYYATLADIVYVSHTTRLQMLKAGTCGKQMGISP